MKLSNINILSEMRLKVYIDPELNHRQVDLTLAHKMNIRFTKISQSPSRPSVGA